MNAPAGFDVVKGQVVNIDPITAMLNPASLHETIHMVLGAYVATAFLVAGIHAFFLLRDPQNVFHRASCSIELVVACVSIDRKSTRLNSSHANISYAVFCLKKKKN